MLMPTSVMCWGHTDFDLKNGDKSSFAWPAAVCRDLFKWFSRLRQQISSVIQSPIKIFVFNYLSCVNLHGVMHFQSPFRSLKRSEAISLAEAAIGFSRYHV